MKQQTKVSTSKLATETIKSLAAFLTPFLRLYNVPCYFVTTHSANGMSKISVYLHQPTKEIVSDLSKLFHETK